MHALSKITGASKGNSDIEATITEFLNSMTGSQLGNSGGSASALVKSHRAIVDVLSDNYTDLQIPLSDVQFNPFVIHRDSQPITPSMVDLGDDNARKLERKRAKRREEIQSAASSLRLKSVIMGGNPLANISGSIVRIGEVVSVEHEDVDFQVTAITNDTVTITANEPQLTLTVDVVLELNQGR